MAIALTCKTHDDFLTKCAQGYKILVGSLAITGNYVTDGVEVDLSAYFPHELEIVLIETKAGLTFEYDYTAKAVIVYYADYDAVADGVLIQVPQDTTWQAATGVKFIAIGY